MGACSQPGGRSCLGSCRHQGWSGTQQAPSACHSATHRYPETESEVTKHFKVLTLRREVIPYNSLGSLAAARWCRPPCQEFSQVHGVRTIEWVVLAEADDKEAGHRLLHERYLQGGLGEKRDRSISRTYRPGLDKNTTIFYLEE